MKNCIANTDKMMYRKIKVDMEHVPTNFLA